MSSRPHRLWRFHVQDAVRAIHRVLEYTHGVTQAGFETNTMLVEAVERNLILIGEAIRHVPPRVTTLFPEVPWRDIRDMRNLVVHMYWGVERLRIWDTVLNDLPQLAGMFERVLLETNEEPPENPSSQSPSA